MKNLILLIMLFGLLACNETAKRASQTKVSNKVLIQDQMKYDSIIAKCHDIDMYTEAISILEKGLTQLNHSIVLQNKIKIDLSGLYLLDYNMDSYGHADTSLFKSIAFFEEVLLYDKENQFFSEDLGIQQTRADSIHVLWGNATDYKEKDKVLYEVTEEIYRVLY